MSQEISSQTNNRPPVSANYTIPTIDLANHTDRQTILDREDGQDLGHVYTILLKDK